MADHVAPATEASASNGRVPRPSRLQRLKDAYAGRPRPFRNWNVPSTKHDRRHLWSALIDCFIIRDDRVALNAARRGKWTAKRNKITAEHSHPEAQLTRLQGIDTIMAIAKDAGLPVYSLSTSTRETNAGAIGERAYYTIADLQQKPSKNRKPKTLPGIAGSGCVEMYVDVDFHLSDDELFRDYGPKCLYTVLPKAVAGYGKNSYWYIDQDGTYNEHVCGGAVYRHMVWDFGSDLVVYKRWFSMDVYHVHVIPGPANRAIACLLPAYKCYLPPFLLKWLGFEMPTLKRVSISSNKSIVQLRSVDANTCDVTVSSRLHTPDGSQVTVKQSTWDALLFHVKVTQTPGVGGVACVAENCGEKLSDHEKYLLAEAVRTPSEIVDPVNFTRGSIIDPGKPFATLACPPLLPPAGAATSHEKNAAAAVQERVKDVKNTTKVPEVYKQYAAEFNSMLFPATEAKLTPLSRDATIKRLINTPTKRIKYLHNELRLDPEDLVAIIAFLKKEVTEGAVKKKTPSRLIFPVDVETLILTAMYTFPLKDWHVDQRRKALNGELKIHTPYIVGLTPEETAKAVCGFVRKCSAGTKDTDFSKMDGTHGPFNVAQYGHHVRSAYRKEEHHNIDAALSRNTERIIKLPIFKELKKRAKFESGTMNLSGKSDTTDCNNWSDAFVQYCANRIRGLSIEDAFWHIGPVFGDDSVCDARSDVATVASDLGMIIKVSETVPLGEPVVMLSRVYVNPEATLTSICEPVRALARIPVTVNADARAGLAHKVAGYMVTDSHCPVVREYCQAIQRLYGKGLNLQKATADELRKLDAAPYPYDPSDADLCISVVSQRIKAVVPSWAGASDTEQLMARLRMAKTSKDLAVCRFAQPEAPPDDIVVVQSAGEGQAVGSPGE